MIRTIRTMAARRNDEGASAVEYGLLIAAIAAIIVLLVVAVGGYVKGAFKQTCDGISSSGVSNLSSQTC